jgi:hypothetical protein
MLLMLLLLLSSNKKKSDGHCIHEVGEGTDANELRSAASDSPVRLFPVVDAATPRPHSRFARDFVCSISWTISTNRQAPEHLCRC